MPPHPACLTTAPEMDATTTAAAAAVLLLIFLAVFGWIFTKNKPIDTSLREKFRIRDGLTFYYNTLSPSATRVRIVLMEKGIQHHSVEVDLLKKENRNSSYLAINPLGKVPAVVVHNVEGIRDCILFESNAITEWLDEQFPDTVQLYPSEPWQRATVKMFQRWEAVMAEDFWPFMYGNVMGFILRFRYSPSAYVKYLEETTEHNSYDYSKWRKTFDGTLMTPSQLKHSARRLFKWLDLLEATLEGKQYLCSNSFSIADISIGPRVILFQVAGLLLSNSEKSRYPNVVRYMNWFASRNSISVTIAGMLNMPLVGRIIERIGNWRSGKDLHRVYGKDILPTVNRRESIPLPLKFENDVVLYSYPLWPDSIMTQIACLELGVKAEMRLVDMSVLEERADNYLSLNPMGEVPTMCYKGKIIYDPKAIVEYLDAINDFSFTCHSLLPVDPVDRVIMRMWQGWTATCFNYQLLKLYKEYILVSILRTKFSSTDDLYEVLTSSTTDSEYMDDVMNIFNTQLLSEELNIKLSPYRQGLYDALAYLNTELSGREFLVSSKLTPADISVFSILILFKWVGVPISEAEYPNISSWMVRLMKLHSVSTVAHQVDEYMTLNGVPTLY